MSKTKLCLMILVLATWSTAARAESGASSSQDINDENGNLFMEEVAPKPKAPPAARGNLVNIRNANPLPKKNQSTVRDGRNQIFMQEVNDQGQSSGPRPFVDLSSVGVQVDPHGNIVPLINNGAGPVKPLYTNTQAFQEMPVPTIQPTYNNPLGLPYNVYGQPAPIGTTYVPVTPGTVPFLSPSYNPFNGTTSFNPYNPRPYYGYGYGYGYPNYYYPGRNMGLNFNLGNGRSFGLGFYRRGFYPGAYGYGYPANPYGYSPYGYGYSPFAGPAVMLGNAGGGSGIALPMPQQSQFSGSFTGSSLLEPFLRDPNSKNSLLEDALKGGLWGNTAGSTVGQSQQGLLGGSIQSQSEQHPTGITIGAPVNSPDN